MKKILLTGGTGFIGRNIYEQLCKVYMIFSPTSKELDLTNREAVHVYCQKYKITDVIHCAVYNQTRRENDPKIELEANLKMFYHLAEYAPNLDKFIYFGSGAEYDKRFPIIGAVEEDFGKTIPMQNDYSISKYIMSLEARNSKNIFNLRLFGVFGKYEDWKTCFISNICCKAVYGLPITIRQECIFDYVHVDQIMPVLKWILEKNPAYHDYNICSGKKRRLTEIAQVVKEISGKEIDIELLKEGMNKEYTASIKRIEQEFPIQSSDFFNEIENLYAYYYDHQNLISFDILKNTR